MSDQTATIFALIVLGPIFIYKKSFVALIKMGNAIRGTKTEISTTTLLFGKIVGTFALISGLLGLLFLRG